MRVAFLGIVAVLAPGLAYAGSSASGSGRDAVITLDLTGRVPAHCGFKSQPASSVEVGDLTRSGSVAIPFRLDCNSNFAVKISSANGGLRPASEGRQPHRPAPSGFVDNLAYDLDLNVDTDKGPVADHCKASELASGDGCRAAGGGHFRGLTSEGGVAIDRQGGLVLNWAAPAGHLVAGRYEDTITVTVEART
jgi:hypothetical protein